jgi:hypothetical protein
MQIDWRSLDWWSYQAALGAWIERSGPSGDPGLTNVDRLKEVLEHRSIN